MQSWEGAETDHRRERGIVMDDVGLAKIKDLVEALHEWTEIWLEAEEYKRIYGDPDAPKPEGVIVGKTGTGDCDV